MSIIVLVRVREGGPRERDRGGGGRVGDKSRKTIRGHALVCLDDLSCLVE